MNLSFYKRKVKTILIVSYSIFLILQYIAIQHSSSYRSRAGQIDGNGNDKLAMYEINELEKAWRIAAVEDLITPEKIADEAELKRARTRLEESKKEIKNSEKRIQGLTGKRAEFFRKVHAYYNHSAYALITIIDFLLARTDEYSVDGNEINFESEMDAEAFRKLINKLSSLHEEKQLLDDFILAHNRKLKNPIS